MIPAVPSADMLFWWEYGSFEFDKIADRSLGFCDFNFWLCVQFFDCWAMSQFWIYRISLSLYGVFCIFAPALSMGTYLFSLGRFEAFHDDDPGYAQSPLSGTIFYALQVRIWVVTWFQDISWADWLQSFGSECDRFALFARIVLSRSREVEMRGSSGYKVGIL